MNAILNMSRKTVAIVFSLSNIPTGVTLLPKLSVSHSKLTEVTRINELQAEKKAEAVFLLVFIIAFPAFLFTELYRFDQSKKRASFELFK